MTLVQKEPKSIKIWTTDIKKVYLGTTQVRPVVPPIPYLCFTAEEANSKVLFGKSGSPTAVTLEYSTDKNTWQTYTFSSFITLVNVWDKVYFRNSSDTPTWFSVSSSHKYNCYLTGKVAASGDITSLLCKNLTTTLTADYCFVELFADVTALTSAPSLPATTITTGCYMDMFIRCTNLTTLPALPATTLKNYCYYEMFYWCSKIYLSTGTYSNQYRIPTTWTWTDTNNTMTDMFRNTWWTVRTPSINTTYYTSNTVA